MDLTAELARVVAVLEENSIDYALCGGLAMAVYGKVRATVDIDLVVQPQQADAAVACLHDAGFDINALPMRFPDAQLEIRRVSRIEQESGEVLTVDLLVPMRAVPDLWEDRRRVAWEGGALWVVSPQVLAHLKSLRGSGVDRDDVAWLEGLDGEG